MTTMPTAHPPGDHGSALILALLATTLITMIGLALLSATSVERLVAASHRVGQELFYACEAGLEQALRDLRHEADWNSVLAGHTVGTFAIAPAEHGEAWSSLTVLTLGRQRESDELHGAGLDRPLWRLYGYGPLATLTLLESSAPRAFLVIWVADDALDGDGVPTQDRNGSILVHAEALGWQGARRAIDVVLRRDPLVEGSPDARARITSWRLP
jgi:hypothetical protein